MYREFFGLSEKPFALVPDPRFLYLGTSHREALAHVLYGIEQGEGFIEVVGQVGTGKTTLCRALLERVGPDSEIAYIFNPSPSPTELLAAINREFGLPTAARTRSDLIEDLNRFLLEKKGAGRRVLLVIDEAQNLDPEVLEQIRLISNLETEREKLIQILLFGQPELDENLAQAEIRQLRQRITVRWKLDSIPRDETAAYVEHRLRVAGGEGRDMFTPGAMRALYRASRGIPRLINAIADRALLAGFSGDKRRVDAGMVRRAARELPAFESVGWFRTLGLSRAGAISALAAGVAVGGSVAVWTSLGPPGWPGRSRPAETAPEAAVPEVAVPEVAASLPASPVEIAPEPVVKVLRISAAAAVDAVLEVWGYPTLGLSHLDPERVVPVIQEATPLSVLETRATREQLERLNLPAMLELDIPDEGRRFVALVTLAADGRLGLDGEGGAYELRPDQLVQQWTGRTFLLWTNFEAVPTLRRGMTGKAVTWLQARLGELGYLDRDLPTGEFDARTAEAVERLQARYALTATSVVGPETLIALYQALRFGTPPLDAGGGVS
jgi:general secretion pathway protein A